MTQRVTAADRFHPSLQVIYFVAVIVFTMAAFQPACTLLSLLGSVAYGCYLRGPRAVAQSALWQVPLIILMCVVNPLFSASGSTVLFSYGHSQVYLESLVYGAFMGCMLVASVNWFANANVVLTSEKIMAFFSNILPVISLMMTMTARLVPMFVRRGHEIGAVQQACPASAGEGKRAQAMGYVRLSSVLVGWSLEDSLETSDAMRARGWGCGRHRSTYLRYRFRSFDACALAILLVLIVVSAATVAYACAGFKFYPRITPLYLWWGYVPYVLLLLLPLVLQAAEELRWR